MQPTGPNPEIERAAAENYLLKSGRDFTAAYMTVANLQFLAREHPHIFVPQTVLALKQVLTTKIHSAQRQSYFLYRKAADALNGLIVSTRNSEMAALAGQTLFNVLEQTQGPAFRAACEALGTLPLSLPIPDMPELRVRRISEVAWANLMRKAGCENTAQPVFKGRNILMPLDNGRRLLVVKTGRTESDIPHLANEIAWMQFLRKRTHVDDRLGSLFRIPEPLEIDGARIFRLAGIPAAGNADRHNAPSKCFAVAFIARPEYFLYPNEAIDHPLPEPEQMHAVINRNAWLLGHLAGMGIIHTAPIPLFHNRVQMHRRTDGGLYEWHRGGRLDRWLESCRYPNVGETGIRDFEHFSAFDAPSRHLYYLLGSHIFSLVLVAGSFFRARAPHLRGYDQSGAPVDVRHLFDGKCMHRLVRDIFASYFEGFTGTSFDFLLPVDLQTLAGRLIDEMGVDRHMSEVLRVADQNEMSDSEFEAFLSQRGVCRDRIGELEKGAADIPIHTGPHLGDFNDRISLPELIEFTSAAAATSIAGKYYADTFSSAILSGKSVI